jgi:hypothetical protein
MGEVTNGDNELYTFDWPGVFLGGGAETITAIATDMLGEQGESGPVTINVTTLPGGFVGRPGLHRWF